MKPEHTLPFYGLDHKVATGSPNSRGFRARTATPSSIVSWSVAPSRRSRRHEVHGTRLSLCLTSCPVSLPNMKHTGARPRVCCCHSAGHRQPRRLGNSKATTRCWQPSNRFFLARASNSSLLSGQLRRGNSHQRYLPRKPAASKLQRCAWQRATLNAAAASAVSTGAAPGRCAIAGPYRCCGQPGSGYCRFPSSNGLRGADTTSTRFSPRFKLHSSVDSSWIIPYRHDADGSRSARKREERRCFARSVAI